MAKMFIAGESTGSSSGQTYDVTNPATGEVVDSAPKGNETDARAAIDAASAAFPAWAETAAEARAQLIVKGIEAVKKEIQELAVPVIAHAFSDSLDFLLIYLGKYPGMK